MAVCCHPVRFTQAIIKDKWINVGQEEDKLRI